MQKKEIKLERLVAEIPQPLKRRAAAKAALEGKSLKSVLVELLAEYVQDFGVGEVQEGEEEETAMLALAA
jgi:hypothetical protein